VKAPHDSSARTAEVLRLGLIEGTSIRMIARQLRLSRKTVRRILGQPRPSARRTSKSRGSLLDPHRPAIRELLDDTPEMLAPAILERLRVRGYKGGISILRELVRQLRPRADPEAFATLEFAPGSALQVDWADFGFALPGVARRVSAFIAVLCYSRMLYLEFTLSQRFGTFVRCMERCLRFFGGVTAVDIFDNMKTVVLEHTPIATVFNPKFLEYAHARGFGVRACNVRKANEKGRVERPVGFVRRRFWPNRRFTDLLDLNTQGVAWRDDFANHRVHEVTGKVPALVFAHEEKPLLKPLPTTPFDTDDIEGHGVTKSFRVNFDRNKYSVSWRLVSQQVLLRANDDSVVVCLGLKQVARHQRCWDVGQDVKDPAHEEGFFEQKPRAAKGHLPPALAPLGELGEQYFKIFAAGSRSVHRECIRLVWLVELFGSSATSSAVAEVMQTGHVGAEYVEFVLRHKRGLTPHPGPLLLGNQELDAIRFPEPDLSIYDQLPHQQLTRDPGEPPQDPSAETS
jgi:transposase